MRRDTEFRGAVHFPSADLHFKRNTVFADDRGVQRLVHVGLRRGNIIFEPPGHRPEHVVNDTQTVVTVNHAVHNDTNGVNIINLVEVFVLHIHFTVYAVNTLNAPVDFRIFDDGRNALGNLRLGFLQKLQTRFAHLV